MARLTRFRTRPFAQVDVFSPTPYLGNPVAVVLDADADDLDGDTMQRVARWANLSETTFVLAPTTPDADYRVRIFTPGGELPFAGHPTLGTVHAWLHHNGSPKDQVVQECAAGLIEVRRHRETLSFAAPPTLRSGAIDEEYLKRIVTALGVDRRQVIDHQWVDNGPGWAVVRLATAREVLRLEPDFSQLPNAMIGAIGTQPDGSPYPVVQPVTSGL
ncbi:PhzF family phenazine biosynthesis protein [Amycolatopsis sp. RTGN1]|uniref:PhzF family phenazine biosynthesis protein n=1 Tax=Amycolatopsis ponsaeliensis TaxID=2992142 RepID=UPI002551C613|nr:PhzF family phenazine biosynthesis protein [Amycolatopsis sp. RTGN1]